MKSNSIQTGNTHRLKNFWMIELEFRGKLVQLLSHRLFGPKSLAFFKKCQK